VQIVEAGTSLGTDKTVWPSLKKFAHPRGSVYFLSYFN